MCRVLEVSESGFYAWCQRLPSDRARTDEELLMYILTAHALSRGTYGVPRIAVDLEEAGIKVGRHRIARLMRAAQLQGVHRRRSYKTTVRNPAETPASDLVDRNFSATGPDQLWVADITYVSTQRGFYYLAVVLDVWSRRIVGWAAAATLHTAVVLEALEHAIRTRQPKAVVHHSDHGCQYTSLEFGLRCKQAGVRPSMGSVGDCYDNAMCESFFATLECELLDRTTFRDHAEAGAAVFDFIDGFYNRTRRHSALDYQSPMNYERIHAEAA